ncbi:thermonuclease family protein [Candidatus Halobeggiatoa sp. HSG11]|nr:thermonuclease family protein [Candidatus Halobeggiatoa sp. HSG11]
MYKYKCKLIKVVDGDTIDAEIDLGFKIFIKERIRLMGIDTPESRTRNKAEKSWGMASKEFLKKTLKDNGNKFELTTKIQTKSKFGRILGTIIIDDIDVNELLVKNKLAIPYTGENKDEARKKYNVDELWNTFYVE